MTNSQDHKGKASDLKGTSNRSFFIGIRGVLLKAIGSNVLRLRNIKDTEDIGLIAKDLTSSGGAIALGEDANAVVLRRSPSGTSYELTLPETDGIGQLTNNGAGQLTWAEGSIDAGLITLVQQLKTRIEDLEAAQLIAPPFKILLTNGVAVIEGNRTQTTFQFSAGLESQNFTIGQIRLAQVPYTEMARPKIECIEVDEVVMTFQGVEAIADNTLEAWIHPGADI